MLLTSYHHRFDAFIEKWSAFYGVPKLWIQAFIGTESSFNPLARVTDSAEDSLGLMQIQISTAEEYGFDGTATDLLEPETNIHYGTAHIAKLRTRHGTDIRDIYSAYNSGKPDTWNHSTQVAANVTRMLEWFTAFGGTQISGGMLMALLAVVLLFIKR